MKIVIYSTNTNFYKKDDFITEQLPRCIQNINKCIKKYTSLEIILTYKEPGMFFVDNDVNLKNQYKNILYKLLKGKNAAEIAEEIIELKPNIAIQASVWTEPFDWISIQDSYIGEILSSKGIKTFYNSVETSLLCFNKKRTRDFLIKNNFYVAKSIYVHHELFRIERSHEEILNNPYQEVVLDRIKNLKYPVIIKDTFGLSSYGMDVVKTFPMAKNILFSKKNSGDRLIEEYIDGLQFGTEIYGIPGNYTIFPPFLFSTNQYGITSPKQSIKIGPFTSKKFHIEELYKILTDLAEKLKICGIAQVDLIFKDGKWFIIEINPRISGMSETVAVSADKTLYELLLDVALQKNKKEQNLKYVCSIKFPIVSKEVQKKLFNFKNVFYVRQIQNKNARQHREEGFCEVIFGKEKNPKELKNDLENLNKNFSDIMEKKFYAKAIKMADFLIENKE